MNKKNWISDQQYEEISTKILDQYPFIKNKPGDENTEDDAKANFLNTLSVIFDIPEELSSIVKTANEKGFIKIPSLYLKERTVARVAKFKGDNFKTVGEYTDYLDWIKTFPDEYEWCIPSMLYYLFKNNDNYKKSYNKTEEEESLLTKYRDYISNKYKGEEIYNYVYRILALSGLINEYMETVKDFVCSYDVNAHSHLLCFLHEGA